MKRLVAALLLCMGGIVAWAQSATNITSTGFTATWPTLAGATSYEVDVYLKQNVTPINRTEGFDSGTVPLNWGSNTTDTYTTAGNYGAASPSMALKQTGASISITGEGQFITELSFWYKGQTTDAASGIITRIERAGGWINLDTIRPLSTTATTFGGPIPIDGIMSVSLVYLKSVGNVAIDDVHLKTDGIRRNYIEGYLAKSISGATSCTVTGLTAGTTYYFVVRGVNGSFVGPNSAEASVTLPLPIDTCTQHPLYSYYGNICDYKQLSGAALKTKLYDKIKGHTVRKYADIDDQYFKFTDAKPNGRAWDIYSNCDFDFITQFDNGGKCSPTSEGTCYNKEHSFPQSWFCKSQTTALYSDIHHIFPTDKYINGKRGNNPYGEVSGTATISSNGAKFGACSVSGYSGQVFEPANEYKGDLARAIFYVVTRYESDIVGWKSCNNQSVLDGTTYPALKKWQLDMLLKWHKNDPVSQKEIDRNNAIANIQHNRNPFVDFPEFAEKIWGTSSSGNNGGTTAVASEQANTLKMYPNPANDVLNVELPEGEAMEYSIYTISGVLQQKGVTQGVVEVSGLASGAYLIILTDKTTRCSARFVKGD